MPKVLKVTLIKSLIAGEPRNVKTAHALGLRKIGQSNTFDDTQVIRGMIHHVKHLLSVEEHEDLPIRRRRIIRGPKAAPAPAAAEPAAAKKPAKKKKEAADESA